MRITFTKSVRQTATTPFKRIALSGVAKIKNENQNLWQIQWKPENCRIRRREEKLYWTAFDVTKKANYDKSLNHILSKIGLFIWTIAVMWTNSLGFIWHI